MHVEGKPAVAETEAFNPAPPDYSYKVTLSVHNKSSQESKRGKDKEVFSQNTMQHSDGSLDAAVGWQSKLKQGLPGAKFAALQIDTRG